MLQSKGTLPSLSKLAKSKNIISGEMKVYDEWAIKVGDFGDLENDQSIELKLEKSDVIHDPQLITLAFPEDTTGTIDRVTVIDTSHTYYDAPTIEISAPINSPKQQATATSVLKADGTLAAINITNAGTGYTTESARLNVVAGELSIANVSTVFTTSTAASTAPVLDTAIAGLSLTNLDITAVAAGASNANIAVSLDISSITTLANIATIVNENATINSHITANTVDSKIQVGSNIVRQSILTFIGTDFILTEQGSTLSGLNLTAGRYEPTQRFAIAAVGNHPTKATGATTASDITVKVNDAIVDSSYWTYDAGSRQTNSFVILGSGAGGNVDGNVVIRGDVNVPITTIASENIETIDGIEYPYATVFVDGHELINSPGDQQFDLTATTITLRNVETLPTNGITQGANVFLVERPTVNFASTYFQDVPGAKLNIKVATNDNIAIITSVKRLHEITPDLKNDDAILIDIDDTSRFLKSQLVQDKQIYGLLQQM